MQLATSCSCYFPTTVKARRLTQRGYQVAAITLLPDWVVDKMIAPIQQPPQVELLPLVQRDAASKIQHLRRRVGFSLQQGSYSGLYVTDNRIRCVCSEMKQIVCTVSLTPCLCMQMRIALARLLLGPAGQSASSGGQGGLLLLDEPTNHLDRYTCHSCVTLSVSPGPTVCVCAS